MTGELDTGGIHGIHGLRGQTVLFVDDDPQVRQALVSALSRAGSVCLEAEGGVSALTLLVKHPEIALVMCDVRMPEMDGIELLTRIRTRWPDIAVMMITGVDNTKIAVHCLSLGAADYLTKPFQLEEVRARVGSALDKRRLTLEHRIYQEKLKEKAVLQARRAERFFAVSLPSLSDALEAKDPHMRGHSSRVSQYASAIAAELHIVGDELRQIELGGQVHDVGKLGLRETVLQKPGKLTDDEYAYVLTYPLIGYRILEPMLEEAPIALRIVRSHHERFDGTGVPDHLAGSAIPLEARIAAIADALDAMTSRRPHRDAPMTFDEAVREVVRCSGTQFDPEIVVAFLGAVKSGRLQQAALPDEAT
ncbi:MAG: HD domain-containing phosphohydrolase [bacterium]